VASNSCARHTLTESGPPGVEARALAAGTHAMGARWRVRTIFQAVDEVLEGTDGWGMEGRRARNLGQAGIGTQVLGPVGQTLVLQEQCAEHTNGVIGRPPPGAWGIERLKKWPGWVQVEA